MAALENAVRVLAQTELVGDQKAQSMRRSILAPPASILALASIGALANACRDPNVAPIAPNGALTVPAASISDGGPTAIADADTPTTLTIADAGARASVVARSGACGSPSYVEPAPGDLPHWMSSPTCRAIARTWSTVPHEDRVCATNADCVVVGNGCWEQPLNRAAAAKKRYQDHPCGNPAAGACANTPVEAVCRGGCCVLERP